MTYSRIEASRPTLKEIEDAYMNDILTDEEYERKIDSITMADISDIEAELGDNIKATNKDNGETITGDINDILEAFTPKNVAYFALDENDSFVIVVNGEAWSLSKNKVKYRVIITQTIRTIIDVEADDEDEAEQLADDMVSNGDVDFDDWDADYEYEVEEE